MKSFSQNQKSVLTCALTQRILKTKYISIAEDSGIPRNEDEPEHRNKNKIKISLFLNRK